MSTKWDVQAAVLNSSLSAMGKLLMHTLLAGADSETATIPAQHSPSLNELARQSSMDKSTVTRTLKALESEGWLERRAPLSVEARKGAKTRYRLFIGKGTQATQEVGAQDTYLGAENTQGRCTCHLQVGAQDTQPRCTVHLKRDPSPSSPSIHRRARGKQAEIDLVITVVKERTGKTISTEQAALVVRQELDNRIGIRNRTGYLESILRKDDAPERFLPTPTPPQYGRTSPPRP